MVHHYPARHTFTPKYLPMETIEVSYVIHRGNRRIKLSFEPAEEITRLVKKISGARFSKTMKSWHMPCHKNAYQHFKNSIPNGWKIIELKESDNAGNVLTPEPATEYKYQVPVKINAFKKQPAELKAKIFSLNNTNLQTLQIYIRQLDLKSYSESTIRTYKNEFTAFLSLLGNREAHLITTDELRRYMQYCAVTLGLSEHTLHSRLNALKFYYEQVLKKEKFFFDIPRPKKPFQLPRVLGEYEIGKLFSALENKKHKAILFTAYSAGLRVSEVVALELKDIDSDRMQIFVRNAKGKKDRYVMLSPVLLDILRNYLGTCRPRPVKYLFEGMTVGEPMSSRAAQHIFMEARLKAGIKKELGFHSLRHSFATHLLEKGVDIKYIKDLLGHFSITTTTRYLHVKKENLVNISSPLDDIFSRGKLKF